MAKALFDLKQIDLQSAKDGATRTLYAGAGVADLAVAAVREYVTEAQKKVADVQKDVSTRVTDVQKSVSTLDLQPKALREQAVTVVSTRVDALSQDAKARRAAIEARVAELQAEALAYPGKVQALVTENVETVNGTYDGLVKRGETLVGRIRRQESTRATATAAKTTTAKAKTTKTQATKAAKKTTKKSTATAKKSASTPKKSAKATTTAAKKTASSAAKATTDAAAKVGD